MNHLLYENTEVGFSESSHTAESEGPLGPMPGSGSDQRPGIGGGASPPPMWHLPTLIGWREVVVKIKVHRYLTKSALELLSRSVSLSSFTVEPSIEQGESLQLADLFPGCEDIPPEILCNMSNESAFAKLINLQIAESSSSLSPAMNRSISSPLLMSLLRSRSTSTPVKPGTESPASPEVKVSPLPVGSATPLSISKTPSPVRIPSTRLDRAAEYLDGTAEGMRRAVLEIGKYQWLMNEIKTAASMCSQKTLNRESSSDDDSKCDTDSDSKKSETKDSTAVYISLRDGDGNGNGSTSQKETVPSVGLTDEIYLNRKSELRKESHLVARDIYIDLLTLYYMQRHKKSPESGRIDHRKSELFKVSAFGTVCYCVIYFSESEASVSGGRRVGRSNHANIPFFIPITTGIRI